MRWSIDVRRERAARQRLDLHRPDERIDGRQVVLDDLRERLVRHVEIEIVVLGAAVLGGVVVGVVVVMGRQLVVMIGAVGEMDRRGRLLAVETVMDVAMRVREPCEEQPERREPGPAFRHHEPRIAAR